MGADVIFSPGVVLADDYFAAVVLDGAVAGAQEEDKSLSLEGCESEISDVDFNFGDSLTVV